MLTNPVAQKKSPPAVEHTGEDLNKTKQSEPIMSLCEPAVNPQPADVASSARIEDPTAAADPWGFRKATDELGPPATVLDAKLRERCITPEINAKLQITYLGSDETRAKYCARDASLEIPYFNVDGQPVLEADGQAYCHARLLNTKAGKYRSQRGDRPHAYLPPLMDWRKIANSSDFAVAITEGEFKAIRNTPNIPTIGLQGITMLLDKGPMLVAELARFNWAKRTVYLIFDAPNNSDILRALYSAYAHLSARDARVEVLDISQTAVYQAYEQGLEPGAKAKMGLDDYLDAGGTWFDLSRCTLSIEAEFAGCDVNLAWMLSNVAYLRGGKGDQYLVLDETFRHPDGIPVRAQKSIRADYAPMRTEVRSSDGKTTRPATFDVWRSHPRRIVCDGVTFDPSRPEWALYEDRGVLKFNDWRGLAVRPKANPEIASRIRAFVHSMFSSWRPEVRTVGQSNEQVLLERWFWNFFANIFQHPDRRPTHSWTIRSVEQGIGKSVLIEMPCAIFGPSGSRIISPDDLFSPYTDVLYGTRYLVANEPSTSYERHATAMKNLRTDATITINLKYGIKFITENHIIINASTNRAFAFGVDEHSRRDIIYQPTWLTESKIKALKDEAHRAACIRHLELTRDVARRLGGTATGPERSEWAAAYLAMLLEHPIDADYSHTGDAPDSIAKAESAHASKPKIELLWTEVVPHLDTLMEQNGGYVFTLESWTTWLENVCKVAIDPNIAKQKLREMVVGVGGEWEQVGFLRSPDNGKIRVSTLLGMTGAEAKKSKDQTRVFGIVPVGYDTTEMKVKLYIPTYGETVKQKGTY